MPFATGWSAGTNDAVLRDLVRYWRNDFDWFAIQRKLNTLAQLRGPIGGPARGPIGGPAELHTFVLARGGDNRVPVLMLHGWPGSFIELLPAAELLAKGGLGGPPCDVIVPSLPGFGFSDAPTEPGMHPGRIAQRMHELMADLGYDRYLVQGGDWGAIVATRMAQARPEALLGLHLSSVPRVIGRGVDEPPGHEERAWREQLDRWRADESGYSQIQCTRPQTLAYGLHDSPLGLLAWILEKFWAWSDHGKDLWDTFDRDDILANVTLYWLTGTVLSAARTYYEAEHEAQTLLGRVEIPTAFVRFPAEPWAPPQAVVERSYRLVRYTDQPHGGHFAALEQPKLLASDVAAFASTLV